MICRRKLKVCFSNSPANLPHATYRDLGFAARADGRFDVYSAGGLGNNPRFGVKTVVQPIDMLAREAVRLIVDLIEGKPIKNKKVELQVTLRLGCHLP